MGVWTIGHKIRQASALRGCSIEPIRGFGVFLSSPIKPSLRLMNVGTVSSGIAGM